MPNNQTPSYRHITINPSHPEGKFTNPAAQMDAMEYTERFGKIVDNMEDNLTNLEKLAAVRANRQAYFRELWQQLIWTELTALSETWIGLRDMTEDEKKLSFLLSLMGTTRNTVECYLFPEMFEPGFPTAALASISLTTKELKNYNGGEGRFLYDLEMPQERDDELDNAKKDFNSMLYKVTEAEARIFNIATVNPALTVRAPYKETLNALMEHPADYTKPPLPMPRTNLHPVDVLEDVLIGLTTVQIRKPFREIAQFIADRAGLSNMNIFRMNYTGSQT